MVGGFVAGGEQSADWSCGCQREEAAFCPELHPLIDQNEARDTNAERFQNEARLALTDGYVDRVIRAPPFPLVFATVRRVITRSIQSRNLLIIFSAFAGPPPMRAARRRSKARQGRRGNRLKAGCPPAI